MRVFGIDCGTQCTGYGVVEEEERGNKQRIVALASGGLKLGRKDLIAATPGFHLRGADHLA